MPGHPLVLPAATIPLLWWDQCAGSVNPPVSECPLSSRSSAARASRQPCPSVASTCARLRDSAGRQWERGHHVTPASRSPPAELTVSRVGTWPGSQRSAEDGPVPVRFGIPPESLAEYAIPDRNASGNVLLTPVGITVRVGSEYLAHGVATCSPAPVSSGAGQRLSPRRPPAITQPPHDARSWSLPSTQLVSFLRPASASSPTSHAPRSSAINTTAFFSHLLADLVAPDCSPVTGESQPLVKAAQLGELAEAAGTGQDASPHGAATAVRLEDGLMIAGPSVVPGMPTTELLSRRSAIR